MPWLSSPIQAALCRPHSDPEDQKKRGQGQVTSIQRHPVLTPALHTLSPGYSSLSTALALVPHTGNTLTQRTKRKGGQGLVTSIQSHPALTHSHITLSLPLPLALVLLCPSGPPLSLWSPLSPSLWSPLSPSLWSPTWAALWAHSAWACPPP